MTYYEKENAQGGETLGIKASTQQGDNNQMTVNNIMRLPIANEHTGARLFMPVNALSDYEKAATEFMNADLAKSGLTPEDIGAFIVPLAAIGSRRWPVPRAYCIPYLTAEGAPTVMWRWRGDTKGLHRDINKYTQPSRKEVGAAAVMPYFPKDWKLNWHAAQPLEIHEGEKKAAIGVLKGQTAIAIGGHSNWRTCLDEIVAAAQALGATTIGLNPDPDILTNMQVQKGWVGLHEALRDNGFEVVIRDHSKIGKFDDFLVAHSIEEYYATVTFLDPGKLQITPEWLVKNIHGLCQGGGEYKFITNGSDNLVKIARKFYGPQLWYNLDKKLFMYEDEPFDEHITAMAIANEFQSRLGFNRTSRGGNNVTASMVDPVLRFVAKETSRSPICDYLAALKWDGVARLDAWTVDYCGAQDSPFIREASKRFLIAAAARALDPGCFLRWRLIFLGPQNVGKSGVWYSLMGRENVAILSDAVAEGKDHTMVLASHWCVVDDELGKSRSRASMVKEKNLLSLTEVSFREPYGRALVRAKLRCVQVGSTNDPEVLPHDPSGNNRHVIVPIVKGEKFDFAGLEAARDQLWAEAVHHYQAGYEFDVVPGADDAARQWEYSSPLIGIVRDAILTEWKREESVRAYVKAGKKHVGVQPTLLAAYLENSAGVRGAKLIDVTGALRGLGFMHERNGLREKGVVLRPAHLMTMADFEEFLKPEKSDALDALK